MNRACWAVGLAVLLFAVGAAADAEADVGALNAQIDALTSQLKATLADKIKAEADLTGCLTDAEAKGAATASCEGSLAGAKKEVEACQADLTSAKSTLSKVKEQQATAQAEAAKLQTALTQLKADLAALEAEANSARQEASAGATCKLSLNKVDSELAALRDALKEAEEAFVPPRLVRLARSASGQLSEAWAELQSSPSLGAAATRAAEVANVVSERAAALREAAAPHVAAALEVALERTQSARAALREVQGELATAIDAQLRAQPALQAYADPVVVQALVWAVLGAPLLLLLPLLAALLGGRGGGKKASAAAAPKKKAPAGGAASKAKRAV